jgi:hypothetical protein
MKLSQVKEIYTLINENCIFSTWSMKEQVNDFICYIESQEDIKYIWNRSQLQEFPYCLKELFFEYMESETYEETEEEEEKFYYNEDQYLHDWYYKNVI